MVAVNVLAIAKMYQFVYTDDHKNVTTCCMFLEV